MDKTKEFCGKLKDSAVIYGLKLQKGLCAVGSCISISMCVPGLATVHRPKQGKQSPRRHPRSLPPQTSLHLSKWFQSTGKSCPPQPLPYRSPCTFASPWPPWMALPVTPGVLLPAPRLAPHSLHFTRHQSRLVFST